MKGGGREKRRRKRTYEDSEEPVSRLVKTKRTVGNRDGLMESNGSNVSSPMLECQLVSECTIRFFFLFSKRPT